MPVFSSSSTSVPQPTRTLPSLSKDTYRNVAPTKPRSQPQASGPSGGSRRTGSTATTTNHNTSRSNSRLGENPTTLGPSSSSSFGTSSGHSNASVISSISPLNGYYPPSSSSVYPYGTTSMHPVSSPFSSSTMVSPPSRLFLTAVAAAPPTRDLDLGNAMTELYTLKKISSMFRTEVKLSICPGVDIRGLLNTMAGTEPGESRPDILHFIGHGATLLANALTGEVIASVPLLMTTTGPRYEKQADAYDASSIARTLSFIIRTGGGPRLIVLQACKTAEFAKRLARAMPNGIILAWQTQVLDEGCHSFSDAFYRHLFATLRRKSKITAKDILIAFIAARLYLGDVFKCTDPEHENSRIGGKRAIGVPILIAGGGIHRDDVVFEISPLSPEVFVAMGGEVQDYPWSTNPQHQHALLRHPNIRSSAHTTLDRRTKRNTIFQTKNQPISESDEGADEENTCDSDHNNRLPSNRTVNNNNTLSNTNLPKSNDNTGRRTQHKSSGTASLSSTNQSGSNPAHCTTDASSQIDLPKSNGTNFDCGNSLSDNNLRMSPMNVMNDFANEETTLLSSSSNPVARVDSHLTTGRTVMRVNGTMLGIDEDENDSGSEFGIGDDNRSSTANDEMVSMQRGDAFSCYQDNMSDTAGFDMDNGKNTEFGSNDNIYSHDHHNEIYSTAEAVSYGFDGNGLPRLVAVQAEQEHGNSNNSGSSSTPVPSSLAGSRSNHGTTTAATMNSSRFVKKAPAVIEDTSANQDNGPNESAGKRKRARTRAVSTSTTSTTVTNAMGHNQRMIVSIEPDNNTFTGMTCASNATLMDGHRNNINLEEISKQVIVVDEENFDMDTTHHPTSASDTKIAEAKERVLHGRTVNRIAYEDTVSPYASQAEERTVDENSLMDIETTKNGQSSNKKKGEHHKSKERAVDTVAKSNVPKKVPLGPWLSDNEIPLELGYFDAANPVGQAAAKAFTRDIFMELPGDEGVTVYIGVDPFEDGRNDTLNAEVSRFRAELQSLPGATPIKGMLSPLAQSTAGSIRTSSTHTNANTTTSNANKTSTSVTDTSASTTYTSAVTTTSTNMTTTASSSSSNSSSDSMSTLQNAQHASEPNISVNPPASFIHRPTSVPPNSMVIGSTTNNLAGTMNNPSNNMNNTTNTMSHPSYGPNYSLNNTNTSTNYPGYSSMYGPASATANPSMLMNHYMGSAAHPFGYSSASVMSTNNYMNMGGMYRPDWNTTYNISAMNQPPNPITSIQASKHTPVTQFGMLNNPNNSTLFHGMLPSTSNSNNNRNNNNSHMGTSLLPSLQNNNNSMNSIGYGYRSVDAPLPVPSPESSTKNSSSSPYMNYGNVSSPSSPSQGLTNNNSNGYFLASPPVSSQQFILPVRSSLPQYQPSVPTPPAGSPLNMGNRFDQDIWDGKTYINPKDMQTLINYATTARYGSNAKKSLASIEYERKEKEEFAYDIPGALNDTSLQSVEEIKRPSSHGKLRISPLLTIAETKDILEEEKQNESSSSSPISQQHNSSKQSFVITVPPTLGARYISAKEKVLFDQDPLVQGLSTISPPEDKVLAARYERITDKALVLYRIIRKLRSEVAYLRSTMAAVINLNNVDAQIQYENLSTTVNAKQKEITELAFHLHRYMCEKRAMDAGNPLNITFRIIDKKINVNNSNGNPNAAKIDAVPIVPMESH